LLNIKFPLLYYYLEPLIRMIFRLLFHILQFLFQDNIYFLMYDINSVFFYPILITFNTSIYSVDKNYDDCNHTCDSTWRCILFLNFLNLYLFYLFIYLEKKYNIFF